MAEIELCSIYKRFSRPSPPPASASVVLYKTFSIYVFRQRDKDEAGTRMMRRTKTSTMKVSDLYVPHILRLLHVITDLHALHASTYSIFPISSFLSLFKESSKPFMSSIPKFFLKTSMSYMTSIVLFFLHVLHFLCAP